jgi:hypothetical protein
LGSYGKLIAIRDRFVDSESVDPAGYPAIPTLGALPVMLDLFSRPVADCSGLSRRSFLRVGGLAAFGLTLPNFHRAAAE